MVLLVESDGSDPLSAFGEVHGLPHKIRKRIVFQAVQRHDVATVEERFIIVSGDRDIRWRDNALPGWPADNR